VGENKLCIGISACLLGEKVRYDGDHARDRYVTDVLGKFADFVPICPETECGLGIPREPIQLRGNTRSPRVIVISTGKDVTDKLKIWTQQKISNLQTENLSAFIFKSKSPSCGLSVDVFGTDGKPKPKKSPGIFAREFMNRLPDVPVEEERAFYDERSRERFISRIFTHQRWLSFKSKKPITRSDLEQFHNNHELLIMAHSEVARKKLTKLITQEPAVPPCELLHTYEVHLFKALTLLPTVKKHTRTLKYALKRLAKILEPAEKREILNIIENFSNGLLPIIMPLSVLRYLASKYQEPMLLKQIYLWPDPVELKLKYSI